MKPTGFRKPIYIIYVLATIIMAGAFSIINSAYAQDRKKETYTRPAPTKPIKPTIPTVNRYQDDKVFLEYADSLYRPANEHEEFQIVKGSVKFRQGGMWMYCDSAYYYPEKNSMDAFGHVKMEQGDTLFVFADKLYYDGESKHATLTHGPSRNNVQLKNRRVTLTTDSLDYDIQADLGWYTTGGRLEDDVNTLTSGYGEYSLATKEAKFRNDVILVNNKDGYRMTTEELDYNTDTHIADINQHTKIEGANDTIITTKGWYNTQTDHAELTSRSIILHRDSSANVTTLEGDSIIYDKASRISRAYMFKDFYKNPAPMVITDTARKVTLIGGYGEYNDSTRMALSAEYPLLIEYSRPDSLFLRADTILSFIETINVWPDSLAHNWDAAKRAFFESCTSPLQLFGMFKMDAPDIAITGIPLPGWYVFEQERKAKELQAANEAGKSKESESPEQDNGDGEADNDNSDGDDESLDSLVDEPKILNRIDALGRDSAYMVPKEFHVAKALGKARFFNKDIQGVADTLIFRERDSMLFMIRKPIVWNEEKQVYGNRINVHFNDSVPDWAELPESGMIAEHIDEDFYNQMTGTEMKAYFNDGKLQRLEVEGNVMVIMLPQEKDSTYNKLINAESSYMTLDMSGNKIEHLKMWPEVSGTVTPLFDVKKSHQFLEGFKWMDYLRPKREWYGDSLHWLDDLGEVPDELIEYFQAPALFKSVKVKSAAEARERMSALPGIMNR